MMYNIMPCIIPIIEWFIHIMIIGENTLKYNMVLPYYTTTPVLISNMHQL